MIHINSVSDIKYIFVVEKGLKRVIWMSSLHLMIPRIAVKIAELQTIKALLEVEPFTE